MRTGRIKAVKTLVSIVSLIITGILLWNSDGFVMGVLEKAMLLSVKQFLYVSNEAVAEATEKSTETEVIEKSSQAVTQTTAVAASVQKTEKLSTTDEDILKLIAEAQKGSSSDKEDGKISEYTYTDDGVTDSFENVRVKNVNETQIDIESILSEKAELSVDREKPAVLIYHSHTTETYQLLDRDFYAQGFLSRSDDEGRNMIRVGKAIAEQIEKHGFKVIHDTAIYDNPYTGAYYRSMDAAESYLEKYPSIQITLDIHRDAIEGDYGVKTKPVAVIDGKKAAQIMIISGCQEEGNGITDLPEWRKNLVFALQLQRSMETLFPGLTRPLYFCPRSYNMSLTPCSLLVEMGSDANTLEEAVYSGKMLGAAISQIMEEYAQ